ncbi:enoyl-CoA hydratase/isomerase family protein [Spongorhabdus nitratireducens]
MSNENNNEPNLTAGIDPRGVVRLTLNRPAVRNAFDDNLIANLIETLEEVVNTPEARVIVLDAAGKHFSAGGDLNWMRRMGQMDEAANRADAEKLAKLMVMLDQCPKPVIGLIQGACYGGAVGLASCCDMVIAADNARFCLSEVKIGLLPATISPFVARAIGTRQSRRYMLSAEVIPAEKALDIGLVHEVVAEDELRSTADTLIAQLLQNSPAAIAATKDLLKGIAGQVPGTAEVTDYTIDCIAKIRASEEGREGLSAFLEKRSPSWIQASGDEQDA